MLKTVQRDRVCQTVWRDEVCQKEQRDRVCQTVWCDSLVLCAYREQVAALGGSALGGSASAGSAIGSSESSYASSSSLSLSQSTSSSEVLARVLSSISGNSQSSWGLRLQKPDTFVDFGRNVSIFIDFHLFSLGGRRICRSPAELGRHLEEPAWPAGRSRERPGIEILWKSSGNPFEILWKSFNISHGFPKDFQRISIPGLSRVRPAGQAGS